MSKYSTKTTAELQQCSICEHQITTEYCGQCTAWYCDNCKHTLPHPPLKGLCVICETLPINGLLCHECGVFFCIDCRDNRKKEVDEVKNKAIERKYDA